MGKSHEIDYQIKGESIQIVEVELDPRETVIAEAGAMLFMEDGIQFEAKMGDGSNPNQGLFDKLLSVGSRVLTGESLFMTHFTNHGNRRAKVGFSAPYPGTVIPIDLSQCPSNQLIVQKDGFLCAALGTQISITFNRKLGSGGLGFISFRNCIPLGFACGQPESEFLFVKDALGVSKTPEELLPCSLMHLSLHLHHAVIEDRTNPRGQKSA